MISTLEKLARIVSPGKDRYVTGKIASSLDFSQFEGRLGHAGRRKRKSPSISLSDSSLLFSHSVSQEASVCKVEGMGSCNGCVW